MRVVVEVPSRCEAKVRLNHGQPATGAKNSQQQRTERSQLSRLEVLEEIARQYEVELLGPSLLEKWQRSGLMGLHSRGRGVNDLRPDVHGHAPGCRDPVDEMAIARAELEHGRTRGNELREVCRQMAPE